MNTSFPLLRLPPKEIERTLRIMEVSDLLFFSMCSKKTRKEVKSLKLKHIHFHAGVGENVILAAAYRNEPALTIHHGPAFRVARFPTPNRMGIHRYEAAEQFNDRIIQARKNIDHFLDVFNFREISHIAFRITRDFRREDVPLLLDGLKAMYFLFIENQSRAGKEVMSIILNDYGNHAKELKMHYNIKLIPNYRSILAQNFALFSTIDTTVLKLDDVLLVNAPNVSIHIATWTAADVRRFVKCLISGSNPNMRYMRFTGAIAMSAAEILSGIRYTEIPPDQERLFRRHMSIDFEEDITVKGGYDFFKEDGSPVTLLLEDFVKFYMDPM